MALKTRKQRLAESNDTLFYDLHTFGVLEDTRELFLGDDFACSCDGEIDCNVANTFIRNLRVLNQLNNNNILIHLNSCGGLWEQGMSIYDSIKLSPSYIVILVYGCAASMASIILQSADLRLIMPHSTLMIHHGSLEVGGSHQSVVSEVELAKKQSGVMLDIYVEKCMGGKFFKGKTERWIRKWLQDRMDKKQEFYMTPQESVERGFIDGILGDRGYESLEEIRKAY